MKSIKISDYFKLIKPKYVFLKLIPNTSIRNYDSTNIIKSLSYIQKPLNQRIYKDAKQWCYEPNVKASYVLDITKDYVNFYLVVPEFYQKIAEAKIREVWPEITIIPSEPIQPHKPNCNMYQLVYRREDALSLLVNRKTNDPLNQMLSVIDIMEENDRLTYYFNFIPRPQFNWSAQYNKTIIKIKEHQNVEKYRNNLTFILNESLSFVLNIFQGFIDAFIDIMGGDSEISNKKQKQVNMLELAYSTLNFDKTVSESTRKKKNDLVMDTQLVILSSSNFKRQQEVLGLSAANSFRSIEDDNELLVKPFKNKENVNFIEYKIPNVITNTMSIGELQNFLQLPGRELIDMYKIIENVNTTQTPVPEELKGGNIRVGYNIYKGTETLVTYTQHKELKNTAVAIVGPNRSGKTTYIANFVYDNIKAGNSVILPDFCGKCELSDELNKVLPPEKIVNVYCDDYNTLQGFGYNEIQPKSNNTFDVYVAAKMKASRLKELINTINDKDNDLEGRMERMMYASALITFINPNTSIKDVFRMLKEHEYRHQLIKNIPIELKDELNEYITDLSEIDDIATKGENKGEVIGTKYAYISPILNRVHRLKENPYVEMMLQKNDRNNFNLINYFNQGKLICLRMYDSMFSTAMEKDIYVCYWLTKVWGALQQRLCNCSDKDKLNQAIILIDELYQVQNAELYLKSILSQLPKYRGKVVVSCHHLKQIDDIQEELKSAMCSYLFLAGSNKKNYYEMKEEFEQLGFNLEDLFNLKQYHALTLLSYEGGMWAGIVKLPPPIK